MGNTILAFNPKAKTDPIWRVMQRLRNGDCYPGVVRDDTRVFVAARNQGLMVLNFDIALPPRRFGAVQRKLRLEQKQSAYSYGFPDGNGDCNCTTWIERLGVPLLTGQMNEFIGIMGVTQQVRRRFGICV